MAAVPFTVVGGFLGAGKTTLVNRILSQSQDVRFAVLVNDFGALNIDAALVESGNGALVPLSNGCICCSLAGGLVQAMMRLMRQRERFDHIVVEASGVSNPSRIMDFARLDRELQANLTLVLADALHLGAQRADPRLADTMEDQLRSADLLVLTKTDLASQRQRREAEAILESLCPEVPRLAADWERLRPGELLRARAPERPRAAAARRRPGGPAGDGHGLHSLAVRAEAPVDVESLRRLLAGQGDRIVRAKGILRAKGARPGAGALYQQVAGRIRVSECRPARGGSELVVTGAQPLRDLIPALRALGFRPCR